MRNTYEPVIIILAIWTVVFILALFPFWLDFVSDSPKYIHRRGKKRKRINAKTLCAWHARKLVVGQTAVLDSDNCDDCKKGIPR